jgi:hypothetical protein
MGTPTLSYLALWYKWSVRMSEEHKDGVRFPGEPQTGSIAPTVEQEAVNFEVGGSNPSRSAIKCSYRC